METLTKHLSRACPGCGKFIYQTLIIWSKEIFRCGAEAKSKLRDKIKVFS